MLMSFIIDGIMTQKLPWSLVLLGVVIAVLLELCGVSSLAFAVGVYLPLSTSAPIFVGGLVRWLSTAPPAGPTARPRRKRKARWGPACCCRRAILRAGPSAAC